LIFLFLGIMLKQGDYMKYTICFLAILSISTYAAEDLKIWKKCKMDSDCKIAPNLACGGLCYHKDFEKDAFSWEKKIGWDCIPNMKQTLVARCVDGLCSCEVASL